LGVRRRIWIINLFYAAIIVWNVLVLFTLHHSTVYPTYLSEFFYLRSQAL
jgi:hypothetical protein